MGKRKQTVPGSIFKRKGSSKLYIRYKDQQIATGLEDSTQNRKIALQMLEKMHYSFLGFKPAPVFKSKKLDEVYALFVEDHYKTATDKTKRLSRNAVNAISPNDTYLTVENINNDVVRFTESATRLQQITISVYLTFYSVFIQWCVKKNYLTSFPEKLDVERKLSRKKERKREVICFTKEEFDLLVQYFNDKDKEFSLLLLFIWHTGARITETLKLTWEQVDFQEQRILFVNKIDPRIHEYLPISSVVVDILHQLSVNEEKPFRWSHTSRSILNNRLNQGMFALGINKQKRAFHSIRRTFATNLFENDVAIPDVMDLMRHKNIQTTLNHYKGHKNERLLAVLEQKVVNAPTAPILHHQNPTKPIKTD
ncbi:MAG: tyrosine-type recombinase/integrase [Candidatus Kapaibacterium sp.]